MTPDRSSLRRTLRERRNALPLSRRMACARSLARRLERLIAPRRGMRIAVYATRDGEIDLAPFIRVARRAGCRLFAPVITSMQARRMEFVSLPFGVGTPFDSSRELIPISPRLLDVVLTPLIAFDAFGWRLGFGAGFYDRKFAFKRALHARRPRLIGVGYSFQQVPRQTPHPWDVLLDAVITENDVIERRTA